MSGYRAMLEAAGEEEKDRLAEVFYGGTVENSLKGTYRQRWAILQAVYYSFLMGLDYNPIGWRENLEEIPFKETEKYLELVARNKKVYRNKF